MTIEELKSVFKQRFGNVGVVYTSPGRVNLIGEQGEKDCEEFFHNFNFGLDKGQGYFTRTNSVVPFPSSSITNLSLVSVVTVAVTVLMPTMVSLSPSRV